MPIIQIALIGFALVGPNFKSPNYPKLQSAWTLALHDPNLAKVSGTPQTNRSCGIARWDDAHVLIYFMNADKSLVLRSPGTDTVGGWSFSLLVIRTQDGRVDQSATIPADGFDSELAIVTGGIVVSDRDRLVFYSRDFRRLDPVFSYKPYHRPIHVSRGFLGDTEFLYVSDDQRRFVLVDRYGEQSRFFLFDGETLKEQRDWTLSGVDPQKVSIREEKIIYGGLIIGDRLASALAWTPIDNGVEKVEILTASSSDMLCRFPIATEPLSFLNTCGSVAIQSKEGNEVIYQPQKHEALGTAKLSPDNRYAAIFRYKQTGNGGVLDLTERVTQIGLLIVNLNSPHRVCEIPLVPMPQVQLTFIFANDSTLVVLNDGSVSSYKELCP